MEQTTNFEEWLELETLSYAQQIEQMKQALEQGETNGDYSAVREDDRAVIAGPGGVALKLNSKKAFDVFLKLLNSMIADYEYQKKNWASPGKIKREKKAEEKSDTQEDLEALLHGMQHEED